jgi:hypothetical protein
VSRALGHSCFVYSYTHLRFLRKGDDGLFYEVSSKTAAEKTSQALRERTNHEKRQRSELRKALRIRKTDLQQDDDETDDSQDGPSAKRGRWADSVRLAPTLNYVGTSLAVPLSLSMAPVVQAPRMPVVLSTGGEGKSKKGKNELNTEGLPPNAVDAEGNVVVTDHDILVSGKGGRVMSN